MKVEIKKIIDSKTFKADATSYKLHKKYGKYITSNKKYLVHHDNDEAITVGDNVVISQIRPISKNKSWILSKIN